jgi:hypothetical protein
VDGEDERQRAMETGCWGGQGSPRAVVLTRWIVPVYGILTFVITHSNMIVLTSCNWSWQIKMGQCGVLIHIPHCPAIVWITNSSSRLLSEGHCFYDFCKLLISCLQKVFVIYEKWAFLLHSLFWFIVFFCYLYLTDFWKQIFSLLWWIQMVRLITTTGHFECKILIWFQERTQYQ